MTSLSLTSGQIKDIISALEKCENDAYFNKNDAHLADYYLSMQNQFELVLEKLQEFIPEKRVANLVLAVN
jgi:hypothetical protein